MTRTLKQALGVAGILLATQAAAQVTFYEGENFRGRAFTASGEIRNLERQGFNDRASSAIVDRGRWQVCEDRRFEGRCVVLRRGNYPSLASMGLGNSISSVRRIERADVSEVAPPPPARRGNAARPVHSRRRVRHWSRSPHRRARRPPSPHHCRGRCRTGGR
jgi:hypothetical protein